MTPAEMDPGGQDPSTPGAPGGARRGRPAGTRALSAGPRDERRRRLWLATGWLLVAVLIALSVARLPPLDIAAAITWSDKIAHASVYAILMWWFAQAYARASWPVIAAACFALGLGLEIAQHMLPDRSASAGDVLANTAGILAGWLQTRHGGAGRVTPGAP